MNADTPDPETTIEFIFDLFAKQGASEYMGEAVTMSQHMEQSAACATADAYMERLSDASISSLMVQGGPMNAAEIEHFEANPYHRDAVRLRRYDDDGKVAGLTIKPVTAYRETLTSLMPQ